MAQLIVFLPLIGFLFCFFFGKKFNFKVSQILTTSLLFFSAILSWILFFSYIGEKETQIIISQTCPPKSVYRGKNILSDIRSSIKYIEPTNDYDNLYESIKNAISDDDIDGVIKECIVFSDFMYSPDSTYLKKFG